MREEIRVELASSPAGPALGEYLVWAWRTTSGSPVVLRSQGTEIGCLANPTPLSQESPKPFYCLRGSDIPEVACRNTIGALGPATTPWMLTRGNGLSNPATAILQAILEDSSAASPFGFSVSNAVRLVIE